MAKGPSYASILVWPIYASFVVLKEQYTKFVILSIGLPEKQTYA